MNTTPNGERTRIILLGRCNVGKSSLINALSGQDVAIVSPEKGTTTDPVRKAMELAPLGPILLCDTPGLDDSGTLGALRAGRTMEELERADLALVVCDAQTGIGDVERNLFKATLARNLPTIAVFTRVDMKEGFVLPCPEELPCVAIALSARTGEGIAELKEAITHAMPENCRQPPLASDLLNAGETAILVTPIDGAAPKGRLILPQQQVIRDLLDAGVISLIVRETELKSALGTLAAPPALVITDSQAFGAVERILPPSQPLTSFSILFARYKGDIECLVEGLRAIKTLKDGDKILISEGCTHHRQDDDIGSVKIPKALLAKTGKKLSFAHSSGGTFPPNLKDYALIVHCGGCMLNRKEMLSRLSLAREAGVPIVNYGVLLAALGGILERALKPLEAKKSH